MQSHLVADQLGLQKIAFNKLPENEYADHQPDHRVVRPELKTGQRHRRDKDGDGAEIEIGRAHVWIPVTNAKLVFRLMLVKNNTKITNYVSVLQHDMYV